MRYQHAAVLQVGQIEADVSINVSDVDSYITLVAGERVADPSLADRYFASGRRESLKRLAIARSDAGAVTSAFDRIRDLS
jgi:hypothetical protein